MPLLRYFIYVGGALLALLFVVSAALPTLPADDTLASSSDVPVIRIRSERKLPERIVLDTTQPTITPPSTVMAQVAAPPLPTPPEVSAKARVRESFAQFEKGASAASNKTDIRSRQAQRRKAARARPPGTPTMLVAQQPHFGFFNTMW